MLPEQCLEDREKGKELSPDLKEVILVKEATVSVHCPEAISNTTSYSTTIISPSLLNLLNTYGAF